MIEPIFAHSHNYCLILVACLPAHAHCSWSLKLYMISTKMTLPQYSQLHGTPRHKVLHGYQPAWSSTRMVINFAYTQVCSRMVITDCNTVNSQSDCTTVLACLHSRTASAFCLVGNKQYVQGIGSTPKPNRVKTIVCVEHMAMTVGPVSHVQATK